MTLEEFDKLAQERHWRPVADGRFSWISSGPIWEIVSGYGVFILSTESAKEGVISSFFVKESDCSDDIVFWHSGLVAGIDNALDAAAILTGTDKKSLLASTVDVQNVSRETTGDSDAQ